MPRFSLVIPALLILASIGQAAGENYFEERTHDFGNVPRGPMLVHHFKLTNPHKETLTISGLRVSCGCVSATAPVTTLAPGASTAVMAQMDSRRFVANKQVTIFVTFSTPRAEEITLLVKAYGRDDFSITPDTLSFGTVRKGSEAKASVSVSMFNAPNMQLTGATCESAFVRINTAKVAKANNESAWEVTAVLRSELPVGKWFTDVWVDTDNPSMPKIRLPLTVEVQPSMMASPANVNFEDMKVGGTLEKTVIVRADKPFRIREVQGADGSVKVTAKSDDARAVHIVTISFKPSVQGDLTRSIRIVAEGMGEEASVTIPLTGRVRE